MSILKKQNGMSLIGWLITIGLIIFVSIPAIKIIPIYIKDMKIHSEMNKLGDDIVNSQEALKITPEKIKSYLLNRFALKGITEITADEIIITESEFNFNVRIQHQFKERIIKDKYFILNSDRTVNIPIITKN
jgi:hypothetical protein